MKERAPKVDYFTPSISVIRFECSEPEEDKAGLVPVVIDLEYSLPDERSRGYGASQTVSLNGEISIQKREGEEACLELLVKGEEEDWPLIFNLGRLLKQQALPNRQTTEATPVIIGCGKFQREAPSHEKLPRIKPHFFVRMERWNPKQAIETMDPAQIAHEFLIDSFQRPLESISLKT